MLITNVQPIPHSERTSPGYPGAAARPGGRFADGRDAVSALVVVPSADGAWPPWMDAGVHPRLVGMAPLPQSYVNRLVLEHRHLARRLAQRYVRGGEPREDLEQAACLGLVKAARRFDPGRGVPFPAFAVPTIIGELRRFCRDTRWALHVPRAMQEQVQALRKVEQQLLMSQGSSPSTEAVAAALGWSHEEVLEAQLAGGCLAAESLNVPLRVSDGTIGEAIECIGDEDGGFASVEQRDELQRALSRLSAAERHALRLRAEFGCSAPEIARRIGVSVPQATRLVGQATRHLRAGLTDTCGTGAGSSGLLPAMAA